MVGTMRPITTIDNLDIKDHVRWAQDQAELDPFYLTEAKEVSQHPELLGNSIIYASQWEQLLEWQKRNQPWATFEPPARYHLTSRHLFSYRIFPNIYWQEEKEESDEEQSDTDEESSEHLP